MRHPVQTGMRAITILFLADTHLGFDDPLRPRIERRRRGHDFFSNFIKALDYARRRRVDFILHGGDLFYRSRIPQSLVSKAFEPLLEIADDGIPVYLVPGNHERSRIRMSLFELHPRIFVFDRPRTFAIDVQGTRVSLSGFPYFRDGVRERFLTLVEETDWRRHEADFRILCMHQIVEGSQVGVQNYTFRRGVDVIRDRDIPSGFAAVLSGHIHRYQVLRSDLAGTSLGSPVFYPGSVERTSFAERGEPKGFLILRFGLSDGEDPVEHTFQSLPARPMYDLVISAEGLSAREVEEQIVERISGFDPNGIVRLTVPGDPSCSPVSSLSARRLRSLAPPTMNINLRYR